jgi:Na+/H+-dicarboxylate symporter
MIGLLRRVSLSQWIVLAMIAGILFGWRFPEAASLIGIAGHTDDTKAVGRLALKFEVAVKRAHFTLI